MIESYKLAGLVVSDFASELKAKRKAHCMSQTDLVVAMRNLGSKVAAPDISCWERGKKKALPNEFHMKNLQSIFGVFLFMPKREFPARNLGRKLDAKVLVLETKTQKERTKNAFHLAKCRSYSEFYRKAAHAYLRILEELGTEDFVIQNRIEP